MNGSLFVKEIEPTSLKIKKDLGTLAKSLKTVTSKTIYVKSVRRLEELCGESKMKPFYVCEICTSSYQEDLRNNKDGHYVALSNEHSQPRKCKGKTVDYVPRIVAELAILSCKSPKDVAEGKE